jgi:hypothetical protein
MTKHRVAGHHFVADPAWFTAVWTDDSGVLVPVLEDETQNGAELLQLLRREVKVPLIGPDAVLTPCGEATRPLVLCGELVMVFSWPHLPEQMRLLGTGSFSALRASLRAREFG